LAIWLGPAQALATLQAPWHAVFLLPRPQLEFWNSNMLAPWPLWQAVAGVAALALVIIILWPRKLALAVFGVGGLGLLSFCRARTTICTVSIMPRWPKRRALRLAARYRKVCRRHNLALYRLSNRFWI
jgi:hypothetical protein